MGELIVYVAVGFAMSMTILLFDVAYAPDPAPLQDFCVGINDTHSAVLVNGYFCKNPRDVTSEDFLYKGFNTVGNTNNPQGSLAVMVNASVFPALNTLGLTMSRIDYAPYGVNSPHLHPRASEIHTLIQGNLYVGFVTNNLRTGGYRLYSKILKPGDMFVFPQGLVHFQLNIGDTHAYSHAAFASQNPGLVRVADTVFGSMPLIPEAVLTRSFQVDERVIEALRSQFFSDDEFSNYTSVCGNGFGSQGFGLV